VKPGEEEPDEGGDGDEFGDAWFGEFFAGCEGGGCGNVSRGLIGVDRFFIGGDGLGLG